MEYHKCICKIVGEYWAYTCPKCPGYEIKFHIATGEMKYKGKFNYINHYGGNMTSVRTSVESKLPINLLN